MRKSFKFLINIILIWRNRRLLEKSSHVCADFGKDASNILFECSQEEYNGIQTLSDLHSLLNLDPKELATDFKKIKTLYDTHEKNT